MDEKDLLDEIARLRLENKMLRNKTASSPSKQLTPLGAGEVYISCRVARPKPCEGRVAKMNIIKAAGGRRKIFYTCKTCNATWVETQ